MTLTEFLLARIAEDEAGTVGHLDNYVQRERRECEAKRRIVEAHDRRMGGANADGCYECGDPAPCYTMRLVALPYADHPDYREEWKP